MDRPVTTLFMLMSVDGRISTGASDELDMDRDLPKIAGLREGTLISALMVGSCVKLFSRWTRRLKPFFHGRKIVHPGA